MTRRWRNATCGSDREALPKNVILKEGPMTIPTNPEDRRAEFADAVFQILKDHPEGVRRTEIIARLPEFVTPTEEELGEFRPGMTRLSRMPGFSTIAESTAGWIQKAGGTWTLTPAGVEALRKYPDPVTRHTEARRLYREIVGERAESNEGRKSPGLPDRASPEAAQEVLERQIPDAEARTAVESVLARMIEHAHGLGPACWSVTLRRNLVRLNVGTVVAFDVYRKSIRFLVDPAALPGTVTEELERKAEPWSRDLRSVGEARGYVLSPASFAQALPSVEPGILAYVEIAAATARVSPFTRAFSPGVVEYLREQVSEDLPDPELRAGRRSRSASRIDIESIFEEFLRDWWTAPRGIAVRDMYAPGREAAQRNWRRVLEARAAGKDYTDLALNGLLPHTNTEHNRERDAWIHVAPAVTRSIREWFEGSGWVKASDWPRVAEALVSFVEQATESPQDLTRACATFAEVPEIKGFQTGMLTPVLNALRPDAFVIVNSKSVKTMRLLAGQELDASLVNYPEANQAIHAFVEEHQDLLETEETEGYPAGDVFDQLCHFVVGVRKLDRAAPAAKKEPEVALGAGNVDRTARSRRVWIIAPGTGAEHWVTSYENHEVSIGWNEIDDLSKYRDTNEIVRLLQQEGQPKPTNDARSCHDFAHSMAPGDIVIAKRGRKNILGWGVITSDYFWDPTRVDHHHIRRVDWRANGDWPVPNDILLPMKTLTNLTANTELVDQLAEVMDVEPGEWWGSAESVAPEIAAPAVQPAYPLNQCAEETGLDLEELETWLRAIQRKQQAILYGPPGTGKTFVSKKIARHLVSESDGFVDVVQFHPSYGYEEFIQGIRPVTDAGVVSYELTPGFFRRFVEKAKSREGLCVLVIDEINRANLPRVFGELMYLLEYRGESAKLPGGGTLEIPDNVRLLGTMNTADRSIALVDHALRRRFAFIRLSPRSDILRTFHQQTGFAVDGLISVLDRLNQKIDNQDYSVGISFFLRGDLETELEDIWRMEIVPYLEEYFFDQEDVVKDFSWETVGRVVLP